MIFDILSDARLPYMIFISILVAFDLMLLRRVIRKEKEKTLDEKRQKVLKKLEEKNKVDSYNTM